MEIFLFLFCIIILFVELNTRSKISLVERAIAQLHEEVLRRTSGSASEASGEVVPAGQQPPVFEKTTLTPPAYVSASPASLEPTPSDKFLAWLKEDWLVKLGGFIILLGFAWLVTYAFMNDWIGEEGRIALGLIAGALMMAFGYRRMQSFVQQGGIFLVLGSTVILLTTFAARSLYHMFDPISALILMFASTAAVAFAGVRFRAHAIAACALGLAAIVPLLVASGRTDWVGLFSYLLIVVLGTLWVVWFTGWRDLIVAAMVIVGFYSMSYLSGWHGVNDDRLLLFGYLFSAIFFLAFAVSIIRRGPSKGRSVDVVAILGNGVFVTMWILGMVDRDWQSLVLAFWAVVFSVGAYLTSLISERKDPFYLHAAVAGGMVAIATARELEGAMLTIAYTIEVALLSLGALWYTKKADVAEVCAWLFAIPGFLALGSMGQYASGNFGYLPDAPFPSLPLFDQHFFAVLIYLLVSGAAGYLILNERKKEGDLRDVSIGAALIAVASLFALALFWFFVHRLIPDYAMATFLCLTIYTVLGVGFYARGKMDDKRSFRTIGIALLVFVVGRLFLADFWTLDMGTKIIVSFVVGALLMGTAFIRKRTTPV